MAVHVPTQKDVLKSLEQLYPSVDIISALQSIPGLQVYVYGGLLRDLALQRQPKEADIVFITNGSIKDAGAVVESVLKQHGFVMLGKVSNEQKVNYHYLPSKDLGLESVIDINIKKRLADAGRDFTINSLCLDLVSGELIDRYEALSDLEKKILRTVEEPNHTFSSRPIIIFRAIKCVCQFNLKIAPSTQEALVKNAPHAQDTLDYIAHHKQTLMGEWMLDNVFRGLKYDPERYFLFCNELGINDIFLRFISKSFGVTPESKASWPTLVRGKDESYEYNLSVFLSFFVRQFNEADEDRLFAQILELFGISQLYKYHSVGIDISKMKFIESR